MPTQGHPCLVPLRVCRTQVPPPLPFVSGWVSSVCPAFDGMYACPIGTYLPALLPPLLQALEDRDQVIPVVVPVGWSLKYFGRYFMYRFNNFPPLFPFPARKGLYRYHFCFFCRFAIALSISVPAGSLGRISGWAKAYQLGSLLGWSSRQGLLTSICTSLYCLRTCANQDLSRSAKACAELSANTPMLPANVLTQAQQRTQLQQQTRSSSNNCKAIKRGRHDDGHALAAAAAVVVQ